MSRIGRLLLAEKDARAEPDVMRHCVPRDLDRLQCMTYIRAREKRTEATADSTALYRK